ncbi:MAG TPA: dienelactone hydrolase family protein [Hyphomonadaceae bacterium]|nr:dienelactone hydrolase family protein [Hyphomonadaceae bacterium]
MGRRVTIKGKDGSFGAYVADGSTRTGPAIVVIQEIFGVNEVMRNTCDWLAGQGYTAVCPDLFWRIQPGIDITDRTDAEWEKAFSYFKAFNVDKGVEDITSTIAWVRGEGHAKVGAVGYCLGGLMAYLTATRTDADAAVGYYGVGIDNYLAEAPKARKPVLLHIAEEDGFVSKESQAKMKAGLTAPNFQLYSYPGRDHAFARVGGAHYHEGDAGMANQRTLDFFASHLK